MQNGKKSVATRLVYDAFDMVEERTKRNGLEIFEQALKNVSPHDGSQASPCRWRDLPGSDGSPPVSPLCPGHPLDSCSGALTLGQEFLGKTGRLRLMDAANNTGSAIRKREETHKMAEANRAFSHYRL